MTSRPFIIAISVVLPMIIMLSIIYFASDIGKKAAPNEKAKDKKLAVTSGGMSKAPAKLPDTLPLPANVPPTLDAAKQKAKKRLEEIKNMSQKEWDAERLKVLHRTPPQQIEEAIARTMLRIKDLDAMDETMWEAEKQRLIVRERAREEIESAPKISEEELRNEVGAMFNKKTPQSDNLNDQ